MKTSACNQFEGTIKAVKNGAVNSEIIIALPNGEEIAAAVTCESVNHLALTEGKTVVALIKAGSILLATDDADVQFSARNQLRGTITEIQQGAVNSVIRINANGLNVSAGITMHSTQALNLQVGEAVVALFKASAVVLAVKK